MTKDSEKNVPRQSGLHHAGQDGGALTVRTEKNAAGGERRVRLSGVRNVELPSDADWC